MKLKEIWMNQHGAVLSTDDNQFEKIHPTALRNYKEALRKIERYKDLEPLGLLTPEERRDYFQATRIADELRNTYPTIHARTTNEQF